MNNMIKKYKKILIAGISIVALFAVTMISITTPAYIYQRKCFSHDNSQDAPKLDRCKMKKYTNVFIGDAAQTIGEFDDGIQYTVIVTTQFQGKVPILHGFGQDTVRLNLIGDAKKTPPDSAGYIFYTNYDPEHDWYTINTSNDITFLAYPIE